MNPAEPVAPSIATTTTIAAAPAPALQQSPTRPALDLPLATLQLPRDLPFATASLHQLPTHSKPSPMRAYAQPIPLTWAVPVPWLLNKQRGQRTRAKPKTTTNSPSVAQSGSPYAVISYAMFKDEDLHMIMWIPALHVIEGYAPGIPTAGPSSRLNQYCGYSTLVEAVFGCGYAAAAASTATYSLQHILMMGNEAGQTRKL